jgi:hypothetical protein
MTVLKELYNPLIYINDEQWLKLVSLLTDNVLEVNQRKLSKIEIMYTEDWHYPAVYFRLSTELKYESGDAVKSEVSGFTFGFDSDWDNDVLINPLTSQGYWDNWLSDIGITAFFAYHEVGIRKIHKFLEQELKIWDKASKTVPLEIKENEWRELPVND